MAEAEEEISADVGPGGEAKATVQEGDVVLRVERGKSPSPLEPRREKMESFMTMPLVRGSTELLATILEQTVEAPPLTVPLEEDMRFEAPTSAEEMTDDGA
ncbi:unnamed protein product [Linum trigynum]|uniref:Uncharacterized protein n=1 Tax=Linum trigynum TaxID=586398 RepID=A0AAV2ETQ0_9ROSI